MSRTVCFWGKKKYSCTLDDNKKQKCGDVFEFSNRHLLLFCILIPLCNSATLYVSHHVLSMTNFYFHFFMRVFSIERSPQPLMKYEIIILSLSLSTSTSRFWRPWASRGIRSISCAACAQSPSQKDRSISAMACPSAPPATYPSTLTFATDATSRFWG